jgi:gamma-glutamylcyclotransferase (GGCT)/AIG2-like uncharacterized protein YtfP
MSFIFVYGTLRQGGSRPIPRLFPTSRFIGFGTVRGWLYHFGAYPGLICDAAGRDILGEVYEVDADAVRVMDDIERYIEGDPAACEYFRRTQTIAMRDGGIVTAELYEVNANRYDCTTPMDTGDWIAWAQAQTDLPKEELWPDGTPVKK